MRRRSSGRQITIQSRPVLRPEVSPRTDQAEDSRGSEWRLPTVAAFRQVLPPPQRREFGGGAVVSVKVSPRVVLVDSPVFRVQVLCPDHGRIVGPWRVDVVDGLFVYQ